MNWNIRGYSQGRICADSQNWGRIMSAYFLKREVLASESNSNRISKLANILVPLIARGLLKSGLSSFTMLVSQDMKLSHKEC